MRIVAFFIVCLSCVGQLEYPATTGLSIRSLGTTANTASADNVVVGPFTPNNNSMLIAFVVNTKASAPDTPTASGNGLTWQRMLTTNYLVDHNLSVWQANNKSGGFAGSFTAATTGISQTGWAAAVMEITGGYFTGTLGTNGIRQNVNSNNSINTNNTVTFAALKNRVLCLSMVAYNLNAAAMTTSEATWRKLLNVNFNTPATSIAAFYQAKNTDTTCLMTNAAAFSGCGVGLEFVQIGNFP